MLSPNSLMSRIITENTSHCLTPLVRLDPEQRSQNWFVFQQIRIDGAVACNTWPVELDKYIAQRICPSQLWRGNGDPLCARQLKDLMGSHRTQTFVTTEIKALCSEPQKLDKTKWKGKKKKKHKTNKQQKPSSYSFLIAIGGFLIASHLCSDKPTSNRHTSPRFLLAVKQACKLRCGWEMTAIYYYFVFNPK